MELRPYQEEAIQAFMDDFEQSGPTGSGLLYLATGAGKTVIAAELSKRIGGPILFLVHREELAAQTIAKYSAVWKGVDIGLVKAQSNELGRTVTVASVQTVTSEKRLNELFFAKNYKLVIADESHHYCSPTFERVLKKIPAYRLGLTATPERSDNAALDHLFSKVLYKYTIIDGIKDGYLSDIQARHIKIDVNLDGVKVSCGDFAAQAISDVMCNPGVMDVIYKKWAEYASDRKTVVFCCDIEHSRQMAEYFSRQGINADYLSGKMDSETRAATLKRYSRGQTQVLTNCMILTEGWDEPAVDCVVVARPTSSQSLYCLDDKTEILTKEGWKGIKDTITNAASFNIKTNEISFGNVSKIVRPKYDDECFYGIENPGLSIAVTNKHNMVYQSRSDSEKNLVNWRLEKAEDLKTVEFVIPAAGFESAPGVDLSDDEIRFLGLFLSDGTINKITNQIVISQSHKYKHCIDFIENTLKGCNFKYSINRRNDDTNFGKRNFPMNYYFISKGDPRGTNKDKTGWGKLLPFIDKRLSESYNKMTRAQVIILLEAINIGDGAKKVGVDYIPATYTITKGNVDFINNLQSLCVRRGIRCNVRFGNDNRHTIMPSVSKWKRHLTLSSSDGRPVFKKRNDIDSPFVWCVETKDGTIITRRNGKVAVLGNCQAVGRGLRLFPGKNDCLLLDVVGNTKKHNLMQVGALTGIPYPVQDKSASSEAQDRTIRSVRDILVAEDEAIEIYRNKPRTFNWIRTGDQLGLQIGFNHYLVVRPTDDGYEAVNCYLKGWKYTEVPVQSAPIVDICLSVAEEYAQYLADKSSGPLQYQMVDSELKIVSPSQKQVALLKRYGLDVPASAQDAAKAISRLFFEFFLRDGKEDAAPVDKIMIKRTKYANKLKCAITLEQIDKLKVLEAGKIKKFYMGEMSVRDWRRTGS